MQAFIYCRIPGLTLNKLHALVGRVRKGPLRGTSNTLHTAAVMGRYFALIMFCSLFLFDTCTYPLRCSLCTDGLWFLA